MINILAILNPFPIYQFLIAISQCTLSHRSLFHHIRWTRNICTTTPTLSNRISPLTLPPTPRTRIILTDLAFQPPNWFVSLFSISSLQPPIHQKNQNPRLIITLSMAYPALVSKSRQYSKPPPHIPHDNPTPSNQILLTKTTLLHIISTLSSSANQISQSVYWRRHQSQPIPQDSPLPSHDPVPSPPPPLLHQQARIKTTNIYNNHSLTQSSLSKTTFF